MVQPTMMLKFPDEFPPTSIDIGFPEEVIPELKKTLSKHHRRARTSMNLNSISETI